MKLAILKLCSIGFNFLAFALIIDVLPIRDTASFFLILTFVSIVVPLLDFGYSRYVFVKMARGLSYNVALSRISSRIALCFPATIILAVIYSCLNDINFWLLVTCLLLGMSPLFLNISRYFFILKEKHAAAVAMETAQPFIFFSSILTATYFFDIKLLLTDIIFLYGLSHLTNFVLSTCILDKPVKSIKLQTSALVIYFSRTRYKRRLAYFSTISVSFEQLLFSLWLFMPVIIYGFLGKDESVVRMSVLQKLLSVVVAGYSIYSIRHMKAMAQGAFCYWGNIKSFLFLAICTSSILLIGPLNEFLFTYHLKSDFINLVQSIAGQNFAFPILIYSMFLFLHIQAHLLATRKLKTRLTNIIVACILQGILVLPAYLWGYNEVLLIATTLVFVNCLFFLRKFIGRNKFYE
jgi:hypothetical protein